VCERSSGIRRRSSVGKKLHSHTHAYNNGGTEFGVRVRVSTHAITVLPFLQEHAGVVDVASADGCGVHIRG
jgi:hypothetical protein